MPAHEPWPAWAWAASSPRRYRNNTFRHFDKYVKACITVLAHERYFKEHPELAETDHRRWVSVHMKALSNLRNNWVKLALY